MNESTKYLTGILESLFFAGGLLWTGLRGVFISVTEGYDAFGEFLDKDDF